MLVDTHCHLNFNDFKEDYLVTAQRALDLGVSLIVVGSELKTSERAVALSEKFSDRVYAAVGVHPIHLHDVQRDKKIIKDEFEVFLEADFAKLIESSKKVVAVGEIGLDYYHIKDFSSTEADLLKKRQANIFWQQLNLAYQYNLPVIIHCREAHEDLYNILEKFYLEKKPSSPWGVIHCFSGNLEEAEKYFSLGLKISFTGLITFNSQWDDLIKKVPLENLLIETDSPYLSPVPYRGKRNEPAYVLEVAKKIAELKGISLTDFAKISTDNAKKLFKI